MAYSEFGTWLKCKLVEKQMTQRQLAAKTKINEKVISDLITGKNKKNAHMELIKKVLE